MKRHHHSPEQERNLQIDCQKIAVKILELTFDDPKSDEAMIRHHAYLRGQLKVFRDLLADDYTDPHPIHDDPNYQE